MPIRNATLLQTWGHHASRKGWLYIPLLFVIFLVSLGPWDGAFPEVLRALRLADTLRTAGPDGLAEALRAENRREQEESIAKARQNVHSLLKQDMKQFWLEGTVVSTPRFISNCKDVITCLRQDVAP